MVSPREETAESSGGGRCSAGLDRRRRFTREITEGHGIRGHRSVQSGDAAHKDVSTDCDIVSGRRRTAPDLSGAGERDGDRRPVRLRDGERGAVDLGDLAPDIARSSSACRTARCWS